MTRDLYYCESVRFYDVLHTHLKSDQNMGTECEEYAFSKDEVGSDMEDNSNLYATPKDSVSLQRMKFPSPSILISSIICLIDYLYLASLPCWVQPYRATQRGQGCLHGRRFYTLRVYGEGNSGDSNEKDT